MRHFALRRGDHPPEWDLCRSRAHIRAHVQLPGMIRCHMSALQNLTPSDLDASGSFVNINEDDSVPIRILKVSTTEIKLANGDVVPPTCIFLQGQTFVWTPPPVDPMTAMPSGQGWEAWSEDVWSIFDMTMPKPGTYVSHLRRNACLWHGKYRFACASQDSFSAAFNGHSAGRAKHRTYTQLTFSDMRVQHSICSQRKAAMSLPLSYPSRRCVLVSIAQNEWVARQSTQSNNVRSSLR